MKKRLNLILFIMLFCLTGAVFAENKITFIYNGPSLCSDTIFVTYTTDKGEYDEFSLGGQKGANKVVNLDGEIIKLYVDGPSPRCARSNLYTKTRRRFHISSKKQDMSLSTGKIIINVNFTCGRTVLYKKKSNGKTYKLFEGEKKISTKKEGFWGHWGS